MGLPVRRIRLRRGERRRLERLVNKRTTPQRVVERANIVLCSAEGRSGSAICREVGVSRPTVTQWLDRYEAGGVEELLEDRPRSGRPRKITPDDEAEIVRKTLEEKPADATHWSCRLMAKEVGVHPLSANVRETRSTQRIRVGRRQRKRTCWDCEREWKRMVVPLEPGRPSEARQLLRTRR